MATIPVVTAGRVRAVESIQQFTLPAGGSITAGDLVRLDTTTGRLIRANATTAGNARAIGVALSSVPEGQTVTAVRKGILDGFDLDALNFDAPLYVSDTAGRIDDTAGTVSVVIGRVVPGTAATTGTGYHKLLAVDL